MAADRRERFWSRWLARLGIAGGVLFVFFYYSHFSLGRQPKPVAERWGEFWAWAFGNSGGLFAMFSGYVILTGACYFRLLLSVRRS